MREASVSPFISREASLALLPAKELARLVRDQSGRKPATRRAELEEQVTAVSDHDLRRRLRDFLKAKHGKKTDSLRAVTSGRRIKVDDLADLRVWGRSEPLKSLTTHLNPEFSDWANMMVATEAFGSVPDDVRALVQSFQGSSVSSSAPGAS